MIKPFYRSLQQDAYLVARLRQSLQRCYAPVDSIRSVWYTFDALSGGVAEWLKAAVLKTAKRKLRGFESHRLLHNVTYHLGLSLWRDARVVNRAVC